MKRILLSTLLLACAVSANAQNDISTASGLFTPSFRDASNTDANNTTYFGWGAGSFDGTVPNNLVDNPPVTLGVGGQDGSLNQIGTDDIISSSLNIYTSTFTATTLELGIPTAGTAGSGFTTIIVQGQTLFGGFNGTPGTFGTLGGATPELVFGPNASPNPPGGAQFWVKYEITGNASSYTLDWTLPPRTSIAGLSVDTQWSSTGFASDTTVVPEPSTALLTSLGAGMLVLLRRRRRS